MRWLKAILLREAGIISHEGTLLLTLLIAPLLYAFMYGSIYVNRTMHNVPLAVVDEDNSALSRLYITHADATDAVKTIHAASLQQAQQMLAQGEVEGYCIIQQHFEKNILSLKQGHVNLAVNASRFLPASDIMMALTKVSLTLGAGVRKTYFGKQGMNDAAALQMANPVNFNYQPLYNPGITYGGFLLPGLLAMILQQTLLIGLAGNLALEREKNTLPAWFSLARGSISAAIFGKGLFYWLTFMVYGIFFLAINFSILGLPVRGSALQLFILTGVFISSIISLAMLLGSFFKTGVLAFQLMGFTSYPFFLITGYSMPFQALPQPLQWFANLVPTTPFLRAYISIVQAGGSLADNVYPLIHLLLLWLMFTILLIWRLYVVNKISTGISQSI